MGKKICFEVMCVTNYGKTKVTESHITDYVQFRLHKKGKLSQLENTKIDFSCDYMNLAIVINSEAGVALNTQDDFIKMLKKMYHENENELLTYTIITGKIDAFSGIEDDCIYPEMF